MPTKQFLTSLGDGDDVFDVDRLEISAEDDWRLVLKLKEDARQTFEISQRKGRSRIDLCGHVPSSGFADSAASGRAQLPALVAGVEDSRSAGLTCRLEADDSEALVTITLPFLEDGFTRHALNAGVAELAKTRRILEENLKSLIAWSGQVTEARASDASTSDKPDPNPSVESVSRNVVEATLASLCTECGSALADDGACPQCGQGKNA